MICNGGGMYTELNLEINAWHKAETWTSDEKERRQLNNLEKDNSWRHHLCHVTKDQKPLLQNARVDDDAIKSTSFA